LTPPVTSFNLPSLTLNSRGVQINIEVKVGNKVYVKYAFIYEYLPGVLSVEVSPPVLWAGQPATGTVTLNVPAPAGSDLPVALSWTPSVTVSGGAIVPKNQSTSNSFFITVPVTPSSNSATITATLPNGAASTTLEIFSGNIVLSVISSTSGNPLLPFGNVASGQQFTFPGANGGSIPLDTIRSTNVGMAGSRTAQFGPTDTQSFVFFTPFVQQDFLGHLIISATYEGQISNQIDVAVSEPIPHPPPAPGPTPV
jgi:hypothetical protein